MSDAKAPGGFFKIARKMFRPEPEGCAFWNEPRVFSRWEAWMDLIQIATWKEHQKVVGGVLVDLQVGETPPLSIRYLARRWGWTPKRVRSWLETVSNMGRLRAHQETPKGHTYILEKYGAYQLTGHSEGTDKGTARAQRGHSEGTARAQSRSKGKKGNKGNEGEEYRSADADRVRTPDVEAVGEGWNLGIETLRRIQGKRHQPRSLTEKRRKVIRKAIRELGPDTARLAARNLVLSPHHRGENDRETEYLEIDLAYRRPEHFAELYDGPDDGLESALRESQHRSNPPPVGVDSWAELERFNYGAGVGE